MFQPRKIEEADVQLARTLFQGTAQVRVMQRVLAEYHAFCALNQRSTHSTLLVWAAAQFRDGRSWGTISTYSGYLNKIIRPTDKSSQFTWDIHRRAIALKYAEQTFSRAAEPASSAQVEEFVVQASSVLHEASVEDNLATPAAVIAMAGLGLRCADLRRIHRGDIQRRSKKVWVKIRVAKNRRKKSAGTILRITPACDIPTEFFAWLDTFQSIEKPFSSTSSGKVNIWLKSRNGQRPPKTARSYSLRKYFVKVRAAALHYAWEQIMEETGHTGIAILKSHYDNF
jgi:integrase